MTLLRVPATKQVCLVSARWVWAPDSLCGSLKCGRTRGPHGGSVSRHLCLHPWSDLAPNRQRCCGKRTRRARGEGGKVYGRRGALWRNCRCRWGANRFTPPRRTCWQGRAQRNRTTRDVYSFRSFYKQKWGAHGQQGPRNVQSRWLKSTIKIKRNQTISSPPGTSQGGISSFRLRY